MLGAPRRRNLPSPPPRAPAAPSSCEQSVFAGHDARGTFCDLTSGEYVPAYHVFNRGSTPQCLQFCLPTENSIPLKHLLRADVGLCCRVGPGFNKFEGSINQHLPGIEAVRAWRYLPGEPDF